MEIDCRQPHMTAAERELLAKVVSVNGKVLEFGSGGSTGFFFDRGVESVVSVESDRQWLLNLSKDPFLASFMDSGRWVALHANIGPTTYWGNPANDSDDVRLCWLNYHQRIWSAVPYLDPDLVLIDGRFRVACLCQTLLNCTNAGLLVFVHDFWSREHYHPMLTIASVEARAGDAVVLRRRPGTDWRLLCQILLMHQFDPV